MNKELQLEYLQYDLCTMNIWKAMYKVWKFRKKNKYQRNWCSCPHCHVDLVSCKGTTYTDTDLVRYVCGNCKRKSEWNFDLPCPYLINPSN